MIRLTRSVSSRCILASFAYSFVVVTPANFVQAQIQPTTTATMASSFTPDRLRCEYRINPLGVDSDNPRLDWIVTASDPAGRGLSQTAYQILVASSPDVLGRDQGDLWD